jgi:hemerythrin
MALLKWKEEYCIGNPGVDYEHRKLIEQISSVYALIDDNADRELIIDCLGDIYGNISTHFALEERMMVKHDYDQYQEHSADHERLLDEIREIADDFEATTTLNEQKFKHQLNDWFQLHFKKHDARLHSLAKNIPHAHEHEHKSSIKEMICKAKKSLFGST